MSRFLGESISKKVVDQLSRRARLADKSTPVLEDKIKVQQFLQSRGVWIRLFSSVNEITEINGKIVEEGSSDTSAEEHPSIPTSQRSFFKNVGINNRGFEADATSVDLQSQGDPSQNKPLEPKPQTSVRYSVKDIVSNSKLAKKYILSGGELEWDGSKFISRQGINFDNNESSRKAYNFTSTFGSRPVPGITSFSITCKNRFCSVREASINFNVWSLEDFKAIQKLYFRPGFSVVLEWGDSLYIDETNSIVESLQSGEKQNIKKFFSDTSFSKVEDMIEEKKEALGTSYDSFIGYIANFNWSLRQDGGYDCSIKVISKGAAIESITVEKSTGFNTEIDTVLKGDFGYRDRSVFHYAIESLDEFKHDNGAKIFDSEIIDFPITTFLQSYKTVNKFESSIDLADSIPVAAIHFPQGTDVEDRNYYYFITLRSLLRIVNAFYLLINTKDQSLEFRFDTLNTNQYLTFTNHFSIAPLECFLPKIATQEALKFIFEDEKVNEKGYSNSPHIMGLSHKLKEFYKIGGNNEILNIGISINKITEILDGILGDPYGTLESKNIHDFIKSILAVINENLGGINDLDIQIDEENNAYIVDRSFTAFEMYKRGINEEKNKIENLKLSGITSLISNLEVQSSISSEIASQIAISAQPGIVPDGQINKSLLAWNKGLHDRFTPSKSSTVINDEGIVPKDYDKKREIFLRKLFAQLEPERTGTFGLSQTSGDEKDGVFTKLNKLIARGGIVASYRIFDEKSQKVIKFIRPEFKSRTRAALYGFQAKENTPLNGLIPITLQFTIDGISGFKIAQCFSIGTLSNPFPLLPDEYSSYSYIIRGIEHSIENNKWFTTISAIPFRPQRTVPNNDEQKEIQRDTTLGEY